MILSFGQTGLGKHQTAKGAVWSQTAKGAVWSGSALFAILFASFGCIAIWVTSWENLFMPYANNKGADQPAHLRSLISAFVVRCLDSIIPLLAIAEISRP